MPYAKELADIPTIYNVTMTNLDTEYSQVLPLRCKKFLIHTRDESSFRLAFETGIVAVPAGVYMTILANCRYFEDDVNNDFPVADRITLYFASDDAGKIIEIVTWR